jgi:hypothetical protein
LALLHHVPGFVREVPLLAGAEMDVVALSEGQRVDPGRFVRIGVNAHVGQVHARERLDSGLQSIRHAGPIGRRPRL